MPPGASEPAQGSAGGVGEAVVGPLPLRVEILASAVMAGDSPIPDRCPRDTRLASDSGDGGRRTARPALRSPADPPRRSAPRSGLSRSSTPMTSPSSINGTTSSEREAGSQAIWPGNSCTSATSTASPRAAAVAAHALADRDAQAGGPALERAQHQRAALAEIKSGPIQIGQAVIDQRRHIGGVGDPIGFAGEQRRQLPGEVAVEFGFAGIHPDFPSC